MPTRCNRRFYCRSYCLLNMFRAPLCPSSGAQECYTLVAACGIWCCGFQVAGLVWSWGLCVRFKTCRLPYRHSMRTIAGKVVSLFGRESTSKNSKIQSVHIHPQLVLLVSRQQALRTGTEERLQIIVLAACVTEVSEKLPLYHGASSQINRNCGRAICECF